MVGMHRGGRVVEGAGSVADVRADPPVPRVATVDDADDIGRLLHDFNVEFGVASPGFPVLASRLRRLLAGGETIAVVGGRPAVAVALMTVRPNVWYEGPIASLDELYVVPGRRGRGVGSEVIDRAVDVVSARGVTAIEINVDEGDVDAQRFYVRHGFTAIEPDTGERAFYLFREL